jgi:hypothetical protein
MPRFGSVAASLVQLILTLRRVHTANRPSLTSQTHQFPYRQDGRYVQHHGSPGRLPPRMRATRYDPRVLQPQMIDKVH